MAQGQYGSRTVWLKDSMAAHSQLPSMSVMYAMRVLVAPSSAFSRKRFADGLRLRPVRLAGGLRPIGEGPLSRLAGFFQTGSPSTGEAAVTPTAGPANELRSSLDLIARVTSPGEATASVVPAVFFIQPEILSRPFRAHKGSSGFCLGWLPSLICRGGRGGGKLCPRADVWRPNQTKSGAVYLSVTGSAALGPVKSATSK